MSDLGVSLTFIICGSVQFNRTWRQCDEFASFLGVTSRSDSRCSTIVPVSAKDTPQSREETTIKTYLRTKFFRASNVFLYVET